MKPSEFLKQNKKNSCFWSSFLRSYVVLFLIFIAFLFGFFLNNGIEANQCTDGNLATGEVYNTDKTPEFLTEDINFDLFWDVWEIIDQSYVKQPVNQTELLYGAMAGSIAILGDPHSVFFDPETTSKFTDDLAGSFEGIGTEIAIKNSRLTVIAPLPDTPAQNAGLRSGDKIMAIDGEDTVSMSLDYAVSKIRGKKGTEVILTVDREDFDAFEDMKIIRDTIHVKSVELSFTDDNIAHIQLRTFNDTTTPELNKAVIEIMSKNPKGIILDLRDNPGGYLNVAVEVASEWVEDEAVVVFERLSDGTLKKNFAEGNPRFAGFKTVVLINEGSASASEIVSGALKDYGLVTLIGQTTFGKGSVQSLYSLEDGSSIKITVAEWLTPNENAIDGEGVEPDIEIELTEEDYQNDLDPQLDKAIEFLNQE